ncbi:hypothetical protein PIB30_000154 [Stylosanthes scabra]|uniref:Fe2OG dioxygenase domain-containing protein n=1 Tax=Stylosanthes scabra TaxID=79078 RepID=A0ABU6R296_9FABA|nr:hypothetical protein [Stylosanthes scabra]
MSEKKKFWQTSQHLEGFGQASVLNEDQNLDWADIYFMTTLPTHMRLPHLFPNLPLPFRETLELYTEELKNISNVIIKKMGIDLNMDEKEMKELFEVDGLQTMRINYYPPCPVPEKVIGVTPHSDGGGLTILLQVSEVEGLQIKKDGIWVPVKPLPNAFIINIGDILEERLSIGTFRSPRLDSILGSASSLITKETPPRFKTIKMKEYVERLFAGKLGVRAYIDVLRI